MSRFAFILASLCFLFASCGERKGYFSFEGRFLHFNQGELYVYSPDGGIQGLDTVKVQDGRFAYETPIDGDATLILIFPNFSTHPVFATSGKSVEIKADASHLKEMEVTGTDENELMNKFRKQIVSVSPPEETNLAARFIEDHPESRVSQYLLRRYFIESRTSDTRLVKRLAKSISKAQPDDISASRLSRQVAGIGNGAIGTAFPSLLTKDINGKKVQSKDFMSGTTVVISYAQWSYQSQDAARAVSDAIPRSGGKLHGLAICVDADKQDVKRYVEGSQIKGSFICDGQMMDTPLLRTFGINFVPEIMIYTHGKVTERGLNSSTLRQRLNNLYK
jgi:hypothetical protein